MPVDQSVLDEIALARSEYELAVRRLGREPNPVELGMFGALWSEHCGYKNSKPLLRLLPSSGEQVLTKAGAENAGAIDIGGGLCVVMKVESHNHPSAIEPYQGAATGVGGIVRDIFAMGARPIAILDSLRFGPISPHGEGAGLSDEQLRRNRYLFSGVVGGVGGYGNCLGIPTVGGEVFFAPSYSGNPLVNAMCVGLARIENLQRARADGPGNPILIVGSDTGRDGIHGASGLASRTDPEARFEELRPAVQVGNPFMEKLLMEACVRLAEQDWIAGLQDLGAAGLTSSIVECAAKAGTGVRIDIAKVPRREEGMTPYEVMLSESQERMLVIAKRGHEQEVADLFRHWELHVEEIGVVTGDGLVRIFDGDEEVVTLPAQLLTDPPLYEREGVRPAELAELNAYDPATLPDLLPEEAERALLALLAAPNIASRRWVYRQYDHQVLTNTVVKPGGDAAVLRVKETGAGLALSTDCNARLCYLDPFTGAAIAVAEAARNVVCTGAQPVAVTDCLNFGNPERPEVYYQLEQCIRGISAACEVLSTPVVSGNVSLYNETGGEAVYPTPVVGMLGLLEDAANHLQAGFREGSEVVLLGAGLEQEPWTLGGSEYLAHLKGRVAGMPRLDLDLEKRLQTLVLEANGRGWLTSAHDCAEGGLAVALAEACLIGGTGLDAGGLALSGRLDAALFGEAQSRIVAGVRPEALDPLLAAAAEAGVPAARLGRAGGGALRLGAVIDLPLAEMEAAHEGTIPSLMGSPSRS